MNISMPSGVYYRKTTPIEIRFWSKVKKTNSCWNWIGCIMRKGHGQITNGTRKAGKILAHRLSWQIHFGEIPDKMCICHKCDNPRCVRPSHLFLGTVIDNNLDMMRKNRNHFGERSGNAKLTEKKVIKIRRYRSEGQKLEAIAKKYKIGVSTVSQIVNRHRWKHL